MAHSERHEELVAAVALGMPLGPERAELEQQGEDALARALVRAHAFHNASVT